MIGLENRIILLAIQSIHCAHRHDEMSQTPLPECWGFNEPFEWNDEMVQELVPLAVSAPPQRSPEFEELAGTEMPARLPAVVAGRFRLQAQAFFLTYSQSVLAREMITQWFSRQSRVKRLIVGLEHHQDGNTHWHVTIEYDHKKDVRNERFFDIDGEHPNIKVWDRTVTYEQWFFNHWKYCKKEDPTPYIVGEEPSSGRKRKRDESFSDSFDIAREQGVKEAMDFLERCCPFDLATKYDQIFRTLTAIRNSHLHQQPEARSVSCFPKAPEIIGDWHCLYINGPTGTGKTAWARALLPEATVVRHRDQLRECDFSKGVIFDDFEVAHWPPTAVIHLLDWDEPSGIDVKHAHVVIPSHTRKIFTHNGSLARWLSKDATDEQVKACERRIHQVNIYSSLF